MATTSTEIGAARAPYLHWGPIVGGALVAAAISLILLTFGSAIGLTVTPAADSWRDATVMLAILSGFWIVVLTVGSMAAGGYLVGRMRPTWSVDNAEEVEFRDGSHGLVMWALAILLGTVAAGLAAAVILVGGAGETANAARSDAQGPVANQADRLLQPEPGRPVASDDVRDEVIRLLRTEVYGSGLDRESRAYLVSLAAMTTGRSSDAAAERVRVAVSAAEADVDMVRNAAVILAFVTAASFVASALAAWEAAKAGGRHRDSAAPPSLAWRRRTVVIQSA